MQERKVKIEFWFDRRRRRNGKTKISADDVTHNSKKEKEEKSDCAQLFPPSGAFSKGRLAHLKDSPVSERLNEGERERAEEVISAEKEKKTERRHHRKSDGRSDDNDHFAGGVIRRPRRLFQAAATAATRAPSPCCLQEHGQSGWGTLGKAGEFGRKEESRVFFCRLSSSQHFSDPSKPFLFLPSFYLFYHTVPRPLGPRLPGPDRRRRGHVGRGPGAGRGGVPTRRIRHEPQGRLVFLSVFFLLLLFFSLSRSFSSLTSSTLFERHRK